MTIPIKILLSILLFLCLLKMPYGYYQFVRIAAVLGFVLLAYTANDHGAKREVLIYILLAVLFQPFIKIALGRVIWNVVDVIAAVGLLVSLTGGKKIKSSRKTHYR